MAHIEIRLDATAQWPDLADVRQGLVERIGALPGGMRSGKASVAIVSRMVDGELLFSEISLDMFLMAAAALQARYGNNEPRGQDA